MLKATSQGVPDLDGLVQGDLQGLSRPTRSVLQCLAKRRRVCRHEREEIERTYADDHDLLDRAHGHATDLTPTDEIVQNAFDRCAAYRRSPPQYGRVELNDVAIVERERCGRIGRRGPLHHGPGHCYLWGHLGRGLRRFGRRRLTAHCLGANHRRPDKQRRHDATGDSKNLHI